MASDSFQCQALVENWQERGDDLSLEVQKVSVLDPQDYQDQFSPTVRLHGTNKWTQENGDFPGRVGPPQVKTRTRPDPLTPRDPQTSAGPQPPGSTSVPKRRTQDPPGPKTLQDPRPSRTQDPPGPKNLQDPRTSRTR